MEKKEQQYKKEGENLVLFEFKADKNRNFPILPFIGTQSVNAGYFGGLFLMVYLLFRFITKRDPKAFLLFYMICGYSVFFAKKSSLFKAILRKQEIYKWFNSYKIVSEEILDDKGTIFPYMPHNILSIPLLSFGSLPQDKVPIKDYVILGTRAAVQAPIVGAFAQWQGVEGVDAKNFKKKMLTKQNILFIPGGFEEATITSHKEYRIYGDRLGFIKYVLETGYNVCPIFCFNEHKGYWTSDIGLKFRLWLNRFKFPACVFWSKYGIIPDKNLDIVIVIGKKLSFPKIQNPTRDEVKQYHREYIKAIRELFDSNVEKYDKGAKLIFYSKDAEIRQL